MLITTQPLSFARYNQLVSMLLRCIDETRRHDLEVTKFAYIKGLSEWQAIELMFIREFYSAQLSPYSGGFGNVLNDGLTCKPHIEISRYRYTQLLQTSTERFSTNGGAVVSLSIKPNKHQRFGLVPLEKKELLDVMTKPASTQTDETQLNGEEFLRLVRKRRIPLSCIAQQANSTIDKIKALKKDKPVPPHYMRAISYFDSPKQSV